MLVFVTASAAFAWMATSIESGGVLASIDGLTGMWLHTHVTPGMTGAMVVISFLGAPSTLAVVTVMACAVLVRKRSYDLVVTWVALVFGGDLLNYGLKLLIHRSRPTLDNPLLTLSSYSFPSGHAMASSVFYGFVIAQVLTMTRQRHGEATAAGIVMIVLVCFSRVYLGVHYVSDVLAGVLAAIAWSTLALTALHLIRAHQWKLRSRRQAE